MRERNFFSLQGFIPYAKGVTAGSPGLQCEASYPGFKSPAYSTLKALLQFVSGRQ